MNTKRLVPIIILVVAAIGVALLYATAPTPARVEPERAIPTVRTIDATPRKLNLIVRSQGTVTPRTQADLIAEVDGRIVWIAPTFAPGGFFDAETPLIRLEARDYELALDRAHASVQRARSERKFAASELARQEGLSSGGVASASQLADANRASTVAEANWLDSRAALEQAERDLERTEIRAPFAGRIREEGVDVGQFVNRGSMLARLYATDYAEIRLPIPDEQLAFLDIPKPAPGAPLDIGGAEVRLTALFAGQPNEWIGHLVRTEGEIDQRSRMVNVVARVEDPYRTKSAMPSIPLAVGLFVQAEIKGPEVDNVIVVPRYAMRNDSEILIVGPDNILHTRIVDVIRVDRDDVLIRGPLGEGERICISPLQIVIEGMPVRAVEDPAEVAERSARDAS